MVGGGTLGWVGRLVWGSCDPLATLGTMTLRASLGGASELKDTFHKGGGGETS